MTPTLRTAILDAIMERWRERQKNTPWLRLKSVTREYIASCLDMILPVAEPMIREAAQEALRSRVEKLEVALQPFRSGGWGAIKAHLAMAGHKDEAAQITRWQAVVDKVLAGIGGGSQ